MKRYARQAFNELRKLGCPAKELHPSETSGHFYIVGELAGRDDYDFPGSRDYAPNGRRWADYYGYEGDACEEYLVMGVNRIACEILEKHGLYAEWRDCGTLKVYDI